jgi:hypothetical protein
MRLGDETETGSLAGTSNRINAYSQAIPGLVRKHWQDLVVKGEAGEGSDPESFSKKMGEEQKGE